jgi:hypothetical protein
MAVPNIFGTATAAIPLSQLDQNFATAITIGNTAVYLGNTTTSLGNVTLTNVTISSGTSNITTNVATVTGTLPEANGGTGTTIGYNGFKNRIINGAMVISQRNGTSATTVNGNDIYTLDRYKGWASGGGVFTVTQSTTAPTGFNNSALITVTTADASIAAGDNYRFAQVIEGYNIADLGFGTASASTVTLSFWVRSSITGTFGGSLYSVTGTRAYVFNYTINAANTWEQKTVTIAGDTSGTWNTTNSQGITVYFDLGSGSNYENATGSWVAAEKFRTSGNATLISTLSNTWYVTGVQLEKGSTATSFDYRPYGTEFQLCQRYYEQWNVAAGFYLANGLSYSTTGCRTILQYQVPKRSTTTATFSGSIQFSTTAISKTITSFSFDGASVNNVLMYNDSQTGLTTGQAMQIQVPGGNTATISFSAEL